MSFLKPVQGVGKLVLALTLCSSTFSFGQGVGINQSTPVSMLDVNGNLTVGANYSGSNAASTNGAIIEGNVGIGTSSAGNVLHAYDDIGSGGNNLDILRLHRKSADKANDQSVGISFYLEDDNNNPSAGYSASIRAITMDGGSTAGEKRTDLRFLVVDDGTETNAMQIRYDGNVGIGTTNPASHLEINETGAAAQLTVERTDGANFYISSNTLTTLGTSDATALDIRTNNTARIRVQSGGNVGIGSTSPGFLLDVAGTAHVDGLNVNGNFSLPTTDGGANEVLRTDGAGTASWIAASSLAVTSVTAGTGLTTGGGPGAITVNAVGGSGLTESANDIDLGGALDQNTTITQGTTLTYTHTNSSSGNYTINLSGTGDFNVQDNGTSALFVRDDGFVGIGGATAPGQELDVNGDIEMSGNSRYIYFGPTTSQIGPSGMRFHGEMDLVYRTGPNQLLVEDASDASDIFWIDLDDDNAYFAGNVGIGSTSPATKLDVVGTSAFLGNMTVTGNVTIPTTFDVTLTDIPTVGTDAANKTYVDAQVASVGGCSLTWQGYTAATSNGALGGVPGANSDCNTAFSGSHACTYKELILLGTSYPDTDDAWVIDGMYSMWDGTDFMFSTVDGAQTAQGSTTTQGFRGNCQGFTAGAVGYKGAYMDASSNRLVIDDCNSTYKLPCCKCQ